MANENVRQELTALKKRRRPAHRIAVSQQGRISLGTGESCAEKAKQVFARMRVQFLIYRQFMEARRILSQTSEDLLVRLHRRGLNAAMQGKSNANRLVAVLLVMNNAVINLGHRR